MEYTGPKVTHQAIQYMPTGYGGGPMTRCWSRWTDGRVTHNDTIQTTREGRDGFIYNGTMYVNIGRDEDMLPPDGLNWVETASIKSMEARHG